MFESSTEQIRELLDSLYGELKNFLAHSARAEYRSECYRAKSGGRRAAISL